MADNVAVVHRSYEWFLKGEVDEVNELLDPGIQWFVPRTVPHGGHFQGVAGVREFFAGVGAAWRPINVDLEYIGEIGPGVVVATMTISGTLAGEDVTYRAVHVFTVVDGRITSFREYVDIDAVMAG